MTTADQIVEAMHAANIGCDEDRIRKEWRMDHSQATDKYMAMDEQGRRTVCDRAIATVECMFCGAKPGTACSVIPAYNKPPLDHFAHCGRWMHYLIDQDLYEMLGGPAVRDNTDISDML